MIIPTSFFKSRSKRQSSVDLSNVVHDESPLRKSDIYVLFQSKGDKKSVMHVQNCCFANLNLSDFFFFFTVLVTVAVVVA